MASSVELREEREWSEGANGQQGKAPEGAQDFNGLAWSRCRMHLEDEDWAMQAVFLERRSELGLVVRSRCQRACCKGRDDAIFSSGACELVRDAACQAS
jgi:hypothetical protein